MSRCKKKVSRWSVPLLLLAASSVGATSDELANAIQLYYAGKPDQAITSIKSLAQAGDAEAQLMLGNMLYGLSQANKHIEFEDSIKWYEMAAAQDSADANAALGVIYHNAWLESRRNEDAAMAIAYYERAIELGDKKAQEHLSKLRRRGGFSVGEKLLPRPEAAPKPSTQTVQTSSAVSEKLPPKPEISPKPEVSPKPSVQTAQTSGAGSASKSDEVNSTAPVKPEIRETYDVGSVRVDLTEVADQCSKYTAEGFSYYGESIKGALMVGKATIESIGPPASQSGTQSVRLIRKQSSAVISLTLQDVPEEVATMLVEKSDMAVTGIVTGARMIDSNCDISLSYQAAE